MLPGIRRFKVRGDSMSPRFVDGDYVFCWRGFCVRPNIGDVVVVKHPHLGVIIKRVLQVNAVSRELMLVGDNVKSTPSQVMGWLSYKRVIGQVIYHIPKPGTKYGKAP